MKSEKHKDTCMSKQSNRDYPTSLILRHPRLFAVPLLLSMRSKGAANDLGSLRIRLLPHLT